MGSDRSSFPLSYVKAHLSEVVRAVRDGRETVIITVDGEPAVELRPARARPRDLTLEEIAMDAALVEALARIPRPDDPPDGVALVLTGRR